MHHQQSDFAKCKGKDSNAVKIVYQTINKNTGRVGGNGNGGPIYGELTEGSMQKIIDCLTAKTGLGQQSRWIDIGCGRGKPNMHVAQDPGVQFSFGIEIQKLRTNLASLSLYHLMNAAKKGSTVATNCFFQRGNITEAKSLDPFTHIYAYDVA